jgi:hypothetical protein
MFFGWEAVSDYLDEAAAVEPLLERVVEERTALAKRPGSRTIGSCKRSRRPRPRPGAIWSA